MNTNTTETLVDILDELTAAGVTNDAIGDAVGKTGQAVIHWRTGRIVPGHKCWGLLAKLSGRTIEDIACAIARGVKPVPRRVVAATGVGRGRR